MFRSHVAVCRLGWDVPAATTPHPNRQTAAPAAAFRQHFGSLRFTASAYRWSMFDVQQGLNTGLNTADQQLAAAQRAVATANAGAGGRSADAAMAKAAQAAIFSEALLGALHSRLEEIKSVTK